MTFFEILSTLLIGPLKLIFEIIFAVAHKLVGHPGLAIIGLSLVMNFLLLPLYKRADAMQEAARDKEEELRHGVTHIKKTFSGDERMMILQTYYRQNNYKPTDALNGSVSLLLEVPFFMAAYQFLSGLQLLEGVSLGPIGDLGAPDGMLVIGGIAVNMLPVLMTLINVISSAIYLKGFPLKTKIQLYAMAGFFLVFLYNSPAGLVFYWTLNNLFSLCKTVFYKLKNPKKVAAFGASAAGLALCAFVLVYYEGSMKVKALALAVGILLQLPLLLRLFGSRLRKLLPEAEPKPDRKTFSSGALLLTVLTGLLIPSTYIASSPQEFVDLANYYNPLWFCVASTCLAAGTFLVWLGVFYWLADNRGKALFDKAVWILCGVMIVNYMFFGTNLGILRSNLQYETGMSFARSEQLLNLAVLGAVCAVMLTVAVKWRKVVPMVLLTAAVALGGMSVLNIGKTNAALKDVESLNKAQYEAAPHFELSTEGQNVVVLMIDRAMASYVPYIFNERPELVNQFDGFTFYSNTISFGCTTNTGSPGLFGGYEYTPVEMNKRSSEPLKEKQNEALKVMPVLFMEEGFQVTVVDPVYANYNNFADVSIYDAYEGINAYATAGRFVDQAQKDVERQNNHRNFFCFSIMKSMPLVLQKAIYNSGNYLQVDGSLYAGQRWNGMSSAEGLLASFMKGYGVLQNLPNMTEITEGKTNTFLMMANDTPHEQMLLQAPDYTPALRVDNREYDVAHRDRFTLDGRSIEIDNVEKMSGYHVNMATFLQLGKWFDYLREQGVYDNTRIILVSDHGALLGLHEQMYAALPDGGSRNVEGNYALLMVKDFGSTGFTTSTEFMTNADVPTIAMGQVIENPVNPFTGKKITNDEKYAHDQIVNISHIASVMDNNGNVFLPSYWASVKENVWVRENWAASDKETVVSEYALP